MGFVHVHTQLLFLVHKYVGDLIKCYVVTLH